MTPDLEALVVAAYVFADEYPVPARPGPVAKIVGRGAGRARGLSGGDGDQLRSAVPRAGRLPAAGLVSASCPSQSQYNRRLRGLIGLLTVVQQRLATLLDVGGARLADGTLIGVANYAGCAATSEFAGTAAYGYCPSKSEWVWGVRLVLRADRRGLPLAYTLVPANEHEYEPLLDLVDPGERVIADKGLWGRAYNQRMQAGDVRLLTPARERTAANHDRERALAGLRLTIESVFANLKEQMRLEHHLARDTPRARPTHRPATPRAHTRNPAQHPHRPPRTRPRRLRRPLTHIKPLVVRLGRGRRSTEESVAPISSRVWR